MDEVRCTIVQQSTLHCNNVYIFQHGMTPLMHCAYHGYVEQCKLLLAKGADVNDCNQKDGVSQSLFPVRVKIKIAV